MQAKYLLVNLFSGCLLSPYMPASIYGLDYQLLSLRGKKREEKEKMGSERVK
jgi:hypothetical protein